MLRRLLQSAGAVVVLLTMLSAKGDTQLFVNSYAVVVGIDHYRDSKWPALKYAVADARGVTQFLRTQGFDVIELVEGQATKSAIVSAVEDQLVPKLTANDRVVFFFAGHGDTRTVGSVERGYLVPVDATDSYGSLLSVAQLHDFSSAMQLARHQLFILDSCFGGLAATRGRIDSIDPRTPDYVIEVTRRRARQLLTAGGANQRVLDGGPEGHSYFTGELLKALVEGTADKNGDGFVTFSELSSYIQVAASRYSQTPGTDVLEGHEQGDFLFRNPSFKSTTGNLSSGSMDVYNALKAGKREFVAKNFATARGMFIRAAELGNAEAMLFLGKLCWEGMGGPKDTTKGLEWFRGAAERGEVRAMQNLEDIYSRKGPFENPAEARRWAALRNEGLKLEAGINVVDPSGQAGRGDPSIPPESLRLIAPTNVIIR